LLIGDGLLDVHRPVGGYVPELDRGAFATVTVEQVMLHTGGFPSAEMSPLAGSDAVRRREQFARWELEWEPGTRFEYHATSAHWVLADLVERLSGADFRDFIERRVTEPLGLPRVLGVPESEQGDLAALVQVGETSATDVQWFHDPRRRAVGSPG